MNETTLTVIGSGDAFGSGGRFNTCFHVASSSYKFLIDCGATSLPGLKRQDLSVDDVDLIIITHFHGDHYGGLPFFLLECAIYQRTSPLTIVSPTGCRDRISALLELLYPGTAVLEKLDLRFIEFRQEETIELEGLKITAFPVVHNEAAQSHGVKIELDDKIISYSGDTEWTDNLVALSRNADMFICECNFFNYQVKGHLNYQVLSEKLSLLNYKKILLTHFDTEMLNKLDQVQLDCASDGQKILI
ncbi:MBL fold metallo-hydrolase [Pedobacter sp. SYSU D00535]|uniref:MBL fold metallo-hydrolase n=1 Tax=Pedobacter sp. SYSU D00535 TaxID=2810308 RepID=UPI001A95A895|nr:MBL fold metallo-hydrolase [Pedobacter sp. SYSU D00535]